MELRGKVAIVTGGTGGLGQRICRSLGAQGVEVVVCYATRREEAESVAAEVRAQGGRALAAPVDVAQPASIQALADQVQAECGRIDLLVNDAADNQWIPFADLEALGLEVWQRILAVNLTGPFLLCRAVAPVMRRQGGGRIVNVTSIAGLSPIGSSIAYAVSKAALTHLTRCLAVALAPEVLVNAVAPGYMEGTRMSANLDAAYQARARQGSLLRRPADKDDVAEIVTEFCRTDSITGQVLVVDSGRIFH
jgi:3-oxoacyl-[acyl-carrier protein] reductase